MRHDSAPQPCHQNAMINHPISPHRFQLVCCVNVRVPGHAVGSCGQRNSVALLQYIKDRLRSLGIRDVLVSSSSCMGCCRHGPVMAVYPSCTWYRYQSEHDVDMIIEQHLKNGEPVKHLLMAVPQVA